MPDPRKCCILGVCCPPGGAEQRADLRTWLLDKLGLKNADGSIRAAVPYTENDVDAWLDELFKDGQSFVVDNSAPPLPPEAMHEKTPPPFTDDGDKLKKKV